MFFKTYQNSGRCSLSRQALVRKLRNNFSSDLVVLSSPGLANILMFPKYAASIIKVYQANEEPSGVSNTAASIQK